MAKEPKDIDLIVGDDVFKLKVRNLPWALKNQIVSRCTTYTVNGEIKFDGDTYIKEVLKYRIVEAPWGVTNEVFLIQLNDDLGDALKTLVPNAFAPSNVNRDELKKESSVS